MTSYAHFGYVVIESQLAAPQLLIMHHLAADATVMRFAEDGSVVAAGDDGNVERLVFTVPHLPGMTELTVQRADVSLRGVRIDQPPSTASKTGSSAEVTLPGRKGGLHRVDLTGLAVTPPAGKTVRLSATHGTPSRFHWREEDGKIVSDTTGQGGDRQLHLMVRPRTAPGVFAPPQAAAPRYDMPDQEAGNPLYGPVLTGAVLRLDLPTPGSARLELDPPVEAEAVQIFLGHNDETGAHTGLPHEAKGVAWAAAGISGVWSIAPTDVEVTAGVGPAAPIQVAAFPGEFPATTTLVDFTPAARSLLNVGYDPAAADSPDLELTLDATSSTAGELWATGLRLTAHYRLESIDGDGVRVTLHGSPGTVSVPVAPGLIPHRLELTVDGRFGPGVLVAASDRDRPGRRAGIRVTGDVRAMRRIDLTTEERARPLTRVGLLGRAGDATEVMVQLHRDKAGRCGAALGDPVGLQLTRSVDAAWHRTDLPLPTDPAAVGGIWVAVHAPTGEFWWYADDDGGEGPGPPAVETGPVTTAPPGTTRVSTDGGATWSASPARPCVQVHYLSERPEPGRMEIHGDFGLLTTDLLTLPARKSHVETTGLDALGRGLEVTADGVLAAATPQPTTVAALTETPASVTFRKEGLELLTEAQRTEVATMGDAITLTFSCDRDTEFRVLDALITYHPWQARPGSPHQAVG